jgi:hypothetical protein
MRAIALLTLLLLAGCADPARNLYGGIKQSNDAKRTPIERSTLPIPDYDTYRKEVERSDR